MNKILTINEYPSAFVITPYTHLSIPYLQRGLTVYDLALRKYTDELWSFIPFNESSPATGTLKIPRGVGKKYIETCIQGMGVSYEYYDCLDSYPEPRNVKINLRPGWVLRDEHQEATMDFLTGTISPQKFIELATGTGKTFLAIYYLSKLNKPAIIISRNLSDQWLEQISKYTYCKNNIDIEVLQGSATLERYTLGQGARLRRHKASVYITSIDTLRSFASRNGWDKLQLICDKLGIGVKLFDEAHMLFSANAKLDVNMQVSETIYLTATPGRSSSSEDKIFQRIFHEVPSFGGYTKELKNYYFLIKLSFNSNPPQKIVNRCSTIRGFNSKLWSDYIFQCHGGFVKALIKRLLLSTFRSDRQSRVLILLDYLKDIETVSQWIEKDPDLRRLGITVGKYCTIVGKKMRESELDNPVIIGTIGSMSAGHDIPSLRVIIPFTTYSSQIVAQQLLGRLRYLPGRATYYIDIVDKGFTAMLEQRRKRMRIIEPRSQKVTELRVNIADPSGESDAK
jgi:hypothetical protein